MTRFDGQQRAAVDQHTSPRGPRACAASALGDVLDGRAADALGEALAVTIASPPSTAHLLGWVDAVQQRCRPMSVGRQAVVLPSYGRPARLPNLTPLLALRLAQEGVPVVVHGRGARAGDVGAAAIFHDLGLPIAHDAEDLHAAWARHEPAFVPIESLCPPLAAWMASLEAVGRSRAGAAIAELIDPLQCDGLRVLPQGDDGDAARLVAFARQSGAAMALLRGTDGEPVADARRQPSIDVWLRGHRVPSLSCRAQQGAVTELPLLPLGADAATAALYVQAVAGGEKPAPPPLERQVDVLVAALSAHAALPPPQPGPARGSWRTRGCGI
jgi:anthranilate phosphoribosyltransferase